jgi:hypothetical protein
VELAVYGAGHPPVALAVTVADEPLSHVPVPAEAEA